MAKEPRPWLKKYTKLEHLKSTLAKQQLYLGSPKDWSDRNDAELIQLYSDESKMAETRATCLTSAPDRFHFWAIFGKREMGVCLWFDETELMRDICEDQTLRSGPVQYKTTGQLKNLKLCEIPFVKRKQYADEQEFRVIRNCSSIGPCKDGFHFSASSLEKIYINPWLSPTKFEQEKRKIQEMLQGDLKHVDVLQNKALRQRSWIDAAKAAINGPR